MRDFVPTPNIAVAARAVNGLGVDLHKLMPKEGNVCFSPYSIQMALGMTYLGASGVTLEEMARVLKLPEDKKATAESFEALEQSLEEARKDSVRVVAETKNYGGPSEAMALRVANRLFAQKGYEFRQPFLAAVDQYFGAPMQAMAFHDDPEGAAREINAWVAKQTEQRIRDLIPPNALTEDTRLVLANALYFKAAWAHDFKERATAPDPFHVNGDMETALVPTMRKDVHLRYFKGSDFQAVALPYVGRGLHFLLVVPDGVDGLAAVEEKLTHDLLTACTKTEERLIALYLPKFKITPPTVELGGVLQKLGMKTAFDEPRGSADFDAMAPKRRDDYLCISNVMHKTFLEIDEKGTEAAAATAVAVAGRGRAMNPPKPMELKVDRPFLFAIQHADSGACLFLGRVSDPR